MARTAPRTRSPIAAPSGTRTRAGGSGRPTPSGRLAPAGARRPLPPAPCRGWVLSSLPEYRRAQRRRLAATYRHNFGPTFGVLEDQGKASPCLLLSVNATARPRVPPHL